MTPIEKAKAYHLQELKINVDRQNYLLYKILNPDDKTYKKQIEQELMDLLKRNIELLEELLK